MAMKKGQNFNHAPAGTRLTVSPIRNPKDIQRIKTFLAGHPRNLAIFTLGVNSNLRASDLVRIKVGDVKHLREGDELVLREQKTHKVRRITLNRSVIKAIQSLLASKPCRDEEALFRGRRGPLHVKTITALVKKWCRAINLNGENYGAHSLRKTFGYIQRVRFGVQLPELMEIFNHSNQKQTLAYLGIQPEELKAIYLNEI
jgi:integrase